MGANNNENFLDYDALDGCYGEPGDVSFFTFSRVPSSRSCVAFWVSNLSV
jgi:hypothetical protein